MENIIRNVKTGVTDGKNTGFELARKLADEATIQTGNVHRVRRVLDYADTFNGERREHYSFDVVEIN